MKIILSSSTSWSLFNARLAYSNFLRDQGYEVVLMSPFDEFTHFLQEDGFRWIELPLKPRGKNILDEMKSLLIIESVYRKERPDIVHHFTPKMVLYGSIAAKFVGIKLTHNTLTGLGRIFSDDVNKYIKIFFIFLFRTFLKNSINIFQNIDNLNLFNKLHIGRPQNNFFIPGSGVDTKRFVSSPQPLSTPVFLLPTRFIEEKGIKFFVEAARILLAEKVNARFVLVGRIEPDQPNSITEKEILDWVSEGIIEYWGWFNNMENVYPKSHVVCLPTFYLEGLPKVLLEAAACGRPMIATDVPGCREIVDDGYNGLLVKPKDVDSLARAMRRLADNPNLRTAMGMKNRALVEKLYSNNLIFLKYLQLYHKSLGYENLNGTFSELT